MTTEYITGQLVRVDAAWTDLSGNAIDPTAVMCTVTDPDGVGTTYTYGDGAEIVRDAVGSYHIDINADSAGYWRYRWYSTGTGQAAARGGFVVR